MRACVEVDVCETLGAFIIFVHCYKVWFLICPHPDNVWVLYPTQVHP